MVRLRRNVLWAEGNRSGTIRQWPIFLNYLDERPCTIVCYGAQISQLIDHLPLLFGEAASANCRRALEAPFPLQRRLCLWREKLLTSALPMPKLPCLLIVTGWLMHLDGA